MVIPTPVLFCDRGIVRTKSSPISIVLPFGASLLKDKAHLLRDHKELNFFSHRRYLPLSSRAIGRQNNPSRYA